MTPFSSILRWRRRRASVEGFSSCRHQRRWREEGSKAGRATRCCTVLCATLYCRQPLPSGWTWRAAGCMSKSREPTQRYACSLACSAAGLTGCGGCGVWRRKEYPDVDELVVVMVRSPRPVAPFPLPLPRSRFAAAAAGRSLTRCFAPRGRRSRASMRWAPTSSCWSTTTSRA